MLLALTQTKLWWKWSSMNSAGKIWCSLSSEVASLTGWYFLGGKSNFLFGKYKQDTCEYEGCFGEKKKKNPFLSVHFSIFLLFPSILIHSCYLNVVCVAYSSVPSCLFHSIWDKYSLHQAMLDQIQPFESINRYLQKSKALNMRQTLHS